jgi:hypothetical protein
MPYSRSTLYAELFVAELLDARKYPKTIDFAPEDKAAVAAVTPVDLARLCSIITHHSRELLGLADFLKLAEDDNRVGEVLTPLPPWFVDAMKILSDRSIDFLALEWAQAEDSSLGPTDCRQILEVLRSLAQRAKFGKRLFLWNSRLSPRLGPCRLEKLSQSPE